jgi:puromycin-sensitive aminopeptidase
MTTVIPSTNPADNPFRLPRSVIPSRYDLTISPDLDSRTFVSRCVVTVEVSTTLHQVVCNASDIEVTKAWVVIADGTRIDAVSIDHDADTERVTATFERTLPVGPARITYEYSGTLNDKLCGFYASTYADADGVVHTIAATQCQATDARKVFPCWDEPDFKAVFGITVVVKPNLTAISNEAVRHSATLASGNKAITFEDTMVMSTYLVCIVVGELEHTETVMVGEVPLRVYHRPGMGNLTAFGLEIGAFSLRYFQEYFDIPYPGRKVDLIALPDFAAGAMENLGAITFRETLLLVDPDQASHTELERVADVVAHEVAHMWFGDLVTMSWWNGIWLNEAFATYAEIRCVDAFRPEWDRWTSFGIYRAEAMAIDALHATRPIEFPVVSPADADGMFDVLTYEKGASILRMLEQYLGEDRFRDGVRHYLRQHTYGNTETIDLFDAIETVTKEPVAEMMKGWIFTGGFPMVSVAATGQGATITQAAFTLLPDPPASTWLVPVLWRTMADDSAAGRVLLRTEPLELGIGEAPIVVNSGGHGFYRVNYDDITARKLLPHVPDLAPIERFGLINDTWASVLAGRAPLSSFLSLVAGLHTEQNPNVWSSGVAGLGSLDQIADDEARSHLRALVYRIAKPALSRLGWEPANGEPAQDAQLRGMLINALGVLGADQETRTTAAERLDAALAGSLDADVAAAVVNVCARTADAALWERFNDARRDATPQEAIRLLHALGAAEDPALRQRTLHLLLKGDSGSTNPVRTQDSPFALIRMLQDRLSGPDAWQALSAAWDSYTATLPANTIGRLPMGLPQRTEPGLPAQITTFFAEHPIPQATQQVQQKLEQLRIYVKLREREAAGLSASLQAVLAATAQQPQQPK